MKVQLVEQRFQEIFKSGITLRNYRPQPPAIQETPRPLLHLHYGDGTP